MYRNVTVLGWVSKQVHQVYQANSLEGSSSHGKAVPCSHVLMSTLNTQAPIQAPTTTGTGTVALATAACVTLPWPTHRAEKRIRHAVTVLELAQLCSSLIATACRPPDTDTCMLHLA